MENQLQTDLTALRAQQQAVDAEVERQRTLLSQQYASAIRKAQADNDMQRAQALYAQAKEEDAALLAKQQQAASAMAGVGDYSLYAQIYGLTDEQRAALEAEYRTQKQNTEQQAADEKLRSAASLMAAAGDYSLYAQLYGLTDAQRIALENAYKKANPDTSAQNALATQEAAAKLMAATGDFSLYGQLYGLSAEQIARLEAQWKAENPSLVPNPEPSPEPAPEPAPAPTPTPTPEPVPEPSVSTPVSSLLPTNPLPSYLESALDEAFKPPVPASSLSPTNPLTPNLESTLDNIFNQANRNPPDNVGGQKLTKTGISDVINGSQQDVWQTPDGKLWIWDSSKGQYLEYVNNQNTQSSKKPSKGKGGVLNSLENRLTI